MAKQLLELAPGTAPGSPALELREIQGDILLGLQKNFERFVFFEIKAIPDFKKALRESVSNRITSTLEVHGRELQLQSMKRRGDRTILPNVGVNLAFTQQGIAKLIPNAAIGDPSFAAGAKTQAFSLGDPVDAQKDPSTWLPQFLNATIDGVFLITGGAQKVVDDEFNRLTALLGASISVSYDETGLIRPGLEAGHEHFGWKDGISQPAILGLTVPFPGQRALHPALFVLGYDNANPPALPWMKNGSFMVFRRLKQLVPEFDKFVIDQGSALGTDSVILGARLVGRWKSGAPLALTPSQDDTTMGPDPQRNNNFDFSDDQGERRCPFGAHIRKTNPRADFGVPDQNGVDPQDKAVDPRRIMRAGIPFGPEVTDAEAATGTTTTDRGLMFVCYQTSIPNQFEFVQTKWANNSGFIFSKKHPDGTPVTVGFDPLIGQNGGAKANPGDPAPRDRFMDEPVPNYPTGNVHSTLKETQDFIIPTAAGYFFVPSIEALKKELST